MKKSTEYLLLFLIILLAIVARTSFRDDGNYGADFFYHSTIVEQALDKGYLDARNDLSLCYTGVRAPHPIGYYAPPYYLAKVVGLDNAFFILPLLLGVLSILAGYLFLQLLFNKKVALFTSFLLAVSLAHTSRSYPFSYRGDNLIYPLILVALSCLYLCLTSKSEKKKSIFALLAGGISGLTSFFWSGYPLMIVVYFASVSFYLLFQYWKKESVKKDIRSIVLSIIAQAVVLYSLFFLVDFQGKGLIFAKEYYFLLAVGFLGFLGALHFTQRKKSHVILLAYVGIGIIAAIGMFDKLSTVAAGFGSVHSVSNVVEEIRGVSSQQLYLVFSFLIISSLAGLYYFIKNFNKEKALFLGLLLPAVYLMFSASRFIYFASIPLIALSGILIDNKKIIKKKFNIFTFIAMLLGFVMVLWMCYAFPLYFEGKTQENLVEALTFLKENSPEDACVVSFADKGATVEFFAKRHYYTVSLGENKKRSGEMYRFLITKEKAAFPGENIYILTMNTDLRYIEGMAEMIKLDGLEFDGAVVKLYNDTLIAPNSKLTFHLDQKEEGNMLKVEQGEMKPLRQYFKDGTLYSNKEGEGCMYSIENVYVYFGEELCGANIYRMITEQEIEGLELVYAEDNIVIYKQLPLAS